MKDYNIRDAVLVSTLSIIIGLEWVAFAYRYFVMISENPLEAFKQSLRIVVPLVLFSILIMFIAIRTVIRKRNERGITVPISQTYIEHLKNTRVGIFIVLIVFGAQIILFLNYVGLKFPSMARRLHDDLVIQMGLGPFLIIFGFTGFIYTLFLIMRKYFKDSL